MLNEAGTAGPAQVDNSFPASEPVFGALDTIQKILHYGQFLHFIPTSSVFLLYFLFIFSLERAGSITHQCVQRFLPKKVKCIYL